MVETVEKSLRHSCRSELTRQGISQASVRIHRLTASHAPVFLVNSRFSLVSATLNPRKPKNGFIKYQAPLLPKLRGHFAEFLNHDYLVRLGILCPTTCVGLGYGRPATSRRSFSRHHRITPTSHQSGHHPASHKTTRIYLGSKLHG